MMRLYASAAAPASAVRQDAHLAGQATETGDQAGALHRLAAAPTPLRTADSSVAG
jgi:hypothetical protein